MGYYWLAFAAYLIPYAFHWRHVGGEDWDQAATWAQIAVWWWQQGDWSTAWNPYLCGGYPLGGNPQLPLFHPATLLVGIFGAAVGLKLMVLGWMSLGFWLARRWFAGYGFDGEKPSLFAAIWVLNGFFVGHLGIMHAHFVCFFLVPGVFDSIRRWIATGRLRHLALLAGLLVVGGIHGYGFLAYFMPFVPLFFVLETIGTRLTFPLAWRRALPFTAVMVLSLGVLAVYLIPALEYLRIYPRPKPPEFENPLVLATYLFFPGKLFRAMHASWEYQVFIGPVLFYFLLEGLWRWNAAPRAHFAALGCAVAGVVLAVGSLQPFSVGLISPLDVIRRWIPGYSNLQVPSRFLIGAVPGLLLLALWRWNERGITRKTTIAVLLPLVAFEIHNSWSLGFRDGFVAPKKAPYGETAGDFRFETAARRRMYEKLEPLRGIANCYESTPLPRGPGATPAGPLFQGLPEGITAVRTGWGRFEFTVYKGRHRGEPVVISQNFHPGWKLRNVVGATPALKGSDDGKTFLEIPPDAAGFSLVFEDPAVSKGRWLTWTAILGLMSVLAVPPLFRLLPW